MNVITHIPLVHNRFSSESLLLMGLVSQHVLVYSLPGMVEEFKNNIIPASTLKWHFLLEEQDDTIYSFIK